VTVTLPIFAGRPANGDCYSPQVKRLVLAIEKRLISETRVFNQHADLIREINQHLAECLQASAQHLNLASDLKSLSDDKRFRVLRHFLQTMLPELGSELLDKLALEFLEKKVLGESLDRFNPKALDDVAGKVFGNRIHASADFSSK
jgi:hypothetical protein